MKKALPLLILAGAGLWLWRRRGATSVTNKPKPADLPYTAPSTLPGRGKRGVGMVQRFSTVW